jgi:hypothetical protein
MSELRADTITASDGTSPVTLTKQSAAKAWYSIDGDAGTPVFFDSFNCASVADGGTGLPTINFTNNMNNNDFAVGALSGQSGGASLSFQGDTPKTTGDVDIRTMNASFNLTDTPNLDGIIMGDLA